MTTYLFFWSFIPFVRCKWDTLNVILVKEPKCLALLIHTLFHLCDYFSSTRSSLQYYGNVCLSQLYMQNSYHGSTIYFLATVMSENTTFSSKCRPAIPLPNTCGDYTEPCEEKSLAIGRKNKFLEIHMINMNSIGIIHGSIERWEG